MAEERSLAGTQEKEKFITFGRMSSHLRRTTKLSRGYAGRKLEGSKAN